MSQSGIFDQFSDAMMSPLFLGGASLLSGGGMGGAIQGMQAGNQFAAQRHKQDEQMQRRQAFDQMMQGGQFGGVPPEMMKFAQAAGPDAGIDMLAKAYQTQQGYGQQERMARLNHDLALKRQQAGGGEYGKAGTIVQAPDGSYHSVQYGARGEPKVTPLQIGGQALTPAKGVGVVGDQMYNKATGAPVRDVAQNIQGAERAKVVGKESGERQMGFAKAQAALTSADAKTDLVLSKIEQAMPLISGWTAGPGGAILQNIPGTAAKDLKEIAKTILANSGFEELQTMRDNSPTGGALGAIAIQELEMLQKVRTSLEQAQSVPQLMQAYKEIQAFYTGARERRRKAFEATYGGFQQPQQAAPANGGWSMQRID